MDDKHDKKKESIDEILSDLNGLLNKMPSILDGIRMPEIQPSEISNPAPAPEPLPLQPEAPEKAPAPAFDADKTVVLESFSGLYEGAQAPEEIVPSPAAEAKETSPESFSGRQDEAAAPEQAKLVPQSLGDFMFGEEAEAGKEENAPLSVSDPVQPADEAALPVSAEAAPDQMIFSQGTPASFYTEDHAAEKQPEVMAYTNTHDFGIPDIDALMQMSGGDKPAGEPGESIQFPGEETPSLPQPEPGRGQEAQQATAEQADEVLFQGLPEPEPQPAEAAPEGDIVEFKDPKEENLNPEPEAASNTPEPELRIEEPEVKQELPFDAFTIEPVAAEVAAFPESSPADGTALKSEAGLDPMAGAALEEQLAPEGEALSLAVPEAVVELPADPRIETGRGVQFGSAAAPSGIELSPGIELGSGIPAQPAGLDETLPGGSGLELGAPAAQPFSGEETLVVAPPAASSGEEEKTVIFQVSPSNTSRAQAGDLSSLAVRQVPEGIPAERVRTMVFLYSPGDEALCATVLAELDAICLKSPTKPMFIKRAYVKECDIDSNANFVHQSVVDSGAVGIICVGAIPQEKIYEIENAFASSGGFFRHYDSASFCHSAALDLVADLIVR